MERPSEFDVTVVAEPFEVGVKVLRGGPLNRREIVALKSAVAVALGQDEEILVANCVNDFIEGVRGKRAEDRVKQALDLAKPESQSTFIDPQLLYLVRKIHRDPPETRRAHLPDVVRFLDGLSGDDSRAAVQCRLVAHRLILLAAGEAAPTAKVA